MTNAGPTDGRTDTPSCRVTPWTAAALGAVAALFISACGSSGGGTSDDTRQKLIDAMVSEYNKAKRVKR